MNIRIYPGTPLPALLLVGLLSTAGAARACLSECPPAPSSTPSSTDTQGPGNAQEQIGLTSNGPVGRLPRPPGFGPDPYEFDGDDDMGDLLMKGGYNSGFRLMGGELTPNGGALLDGLGAQEDDGHPKSGVDALTDEYYRAALGGKNPGAERPEPAPLGGMEERKREEDARWGEAHDPMVRPDVEALEWYEENQRRLRAELEKDREDARTRSRTHEEANKMARKIIEDPSGEKAREFQDAAKSGFFDRRFVNYVRDAIVENGERVRDEAMKDARNPTPPQGQQTGTGLRRWAEQYGELTPPLTGTAERTVTRENRVERPFGMGTTTTHYSDGTRKITIELPGGREITEIRADGTVSGWTEDKDGEMVSRHFEWGDGYRATIRSGGGISVEVTPKSESAPAAESGKPASTRAIQAQAGGGFQIDASAGYSEPPPVTGTDAAAAPRLGPAP